MNKENFQKQIGNKTTDLYEIKSDNSRLYLCNYGARIIAWKVKNRSGNWVDIVLGFDTIDKYLEASEQYHGVTVGRYANRIAGGSFQVDGESYVLDQNNGNNSLHGGPGGFHNQVWEVESVQAHELVFQLESPHLDQGFPGALEVSVRFSIIENELSITYHATTDRKTILNMTHHSYFNLNGEGSGSILDHEARFSADFYTPIDNDQIPTGETSPVFDGPFDFTDWTPIGKHIEDVHPQLDRGAGYDHNFIVNNYYKGSLAFQASVRSPDTGIQISCWSDKPGFQFYTGNFLDGSDVGKSGVAYDRRTAFAIEPQFFPDTPNKTNFPSAEISPDQPYNSTTVYKIRLYDDH